MADTQRLKVFKNVICPFAKHIRQDRIGGVVNGTCALGYTNTSLVGLGSHRRPQLIGLNFQSNAQFAVAS